MGGRVGRRAGQLLLHEGRTALVEVAGVQVRLCLRLCLRLSLGLGLSLSLSLRLGLLGRGLSARRTGRQARGVEGGRAHLLLVLDDGALHGGQRAQMLVRVQLLLSLLRL